MLQRLESSRAAGQWSGAHDKSSCGSCSSSLAFDTDEAMSASSKMAKEAGEAMSESSWTALAKGQEKDWWSIDLEGDMEKLEVVGPWSGTEGGSMDPKAVVVEGGNWKQNGTKWFHCGLGSMPKVSTTCTKHPRINFIWRVWCGPLIKSVMLT